MSLKKRLHEILEVARPGDRLSRIFDLSICGLIVLNVIAMIVETILPVGSEAQHSFKVFEASSVIIFTIEYILRVWSCTESRRYQHPFWGRLLYIFTMLALVDLLAIIPFYMPLIGIDLRFMRIIRLFRLFRIAKLGRYSNAFNLLSYVIRLKKEELVTTFFFLIVLLLMASSLMYFAEGEEQPDHFSSIPASMWWAVATLTTVGYGDVYPVTAGGRLLASVIAILGIGMFALPTGILGAGFVEAIEKRKKHEKTKTCPHCGRTIAD